MRILFVTTLLSSAQINIYLEETENVSQKVESFTSEYATIYAYTLEAPSKNHSTQNFKVKLVDDLEIGDEILDKNFGNILIRTENYEKFLVGQVCKFNGTLEKPENFSDFNYIEYLEKQDVFLLMESSEYECIDVNVARKGSILQNFLLDLKANLIMVIDKKLPEPQSSLLAGILFGEDRLFSEDFDENVRISGVSHIVAASGYNITILVILVSKIFFFIPKRGKVILGLIVIWLFAILSGLSSSIIRACIMSTLSLIALLFGRGNIIHISFPLTSAIFVLFKPMILFDVGFLLSVSATFGLIYLLPILINFRKKFSKKLTFLDEYLFPTMSCTLCTIPISIITFNTFSIWSIPVNAVILPVIEGTMLWGALAIVFSKIFSSISQFFFTVVYLQLKYFEYIVNFIGDLNFGAWEIGSSITLIIGLLILIFVILIVIYFYPVKNESYNYYLREE